MQKQVLLQMKWNCNNLMLPLKDMKQDIKKDQIRHYILTHKYRPQTSMVLDKNNTEVTQYTLLIHLY